MIIFFVSTFVKLFNYLSLPLIYTLAISSKIHLVIIQDKPDWQAVRDHLKKEGLLEKSGLLKIISLSKSVMSIYN